MSGAGAYSARRPVLAGSADERVPDPPPLRGFRPLVRPGTIQLDGDTASGRAYIAEFGRMRDGSCHLNYAIYHDLYQRTPDGWRFAERVYEVTYVDNTPLAGSAPGSNRAFLS